MKLACDLCGGTLQMNSGGQDATCTDCGLVYPLSRLHEKLDGRNKQGKTTQKTEKPVLKKAAAFVPEQFVMENNGTGVGDLSGRVKQGGIGLGDKIYIDGDYDRPYTVYCINDNPYMTCAKEGMPAELFLVTCPRKVLKNARRITGDPNPVANAYNYPGTVEEYFAYVLQREFSQYELRKAVPCEDLTIPASFMLYESGKAVAAVFLVGSKDGKARYQAKKAAKVLGARGIGCTYFFEDYRNDAPYVTKRVQEVLAVQ